MILWVGKMFNDRNLKWFYVVISAGFVLAAISPFYIILFDPKPSDRSDGQQFLLMLMFLGPFLCGLYGIVRGVLFAAYRDWRRCIKVVLSALSLIVLQAVVFLATIFIDSTGFI